MAGGKRHIRHVLRQAGQIRLQASRNGSCFETQLRGFYRSRLADSGFDMVPMPKWRAKRMAWPQGDPEKSKFLTEISAEHRKSIDKVAEAMAAVKELRRK